mmetsp:Transcript_10553/g.23272  ORF Transcript_10553/g.23272 Transcript_10553/m.23272 type:complete len:227 (+) Transcript_10553:405-1085(+)
MWFPPNHCECDNRLGHLFGQRKRCSSCGDTRCQHRKLGHIQVGDGNLQCTGIIARGGSVGAPMPRQIHRECHPALIGSSSQHPITFPTGPACLVQAQDRCACVRRILQLGSNKMHVLTLWGADHPSCHSNWLNMKVVLHLGSDEKLSVNDETTHHRGVQHKRPLGIFHALDYCLLECRRLPHWHLWKLHEFLSVISHLLDVVQRSLGNFRSWIPYQRFLIGLFSLF